MDHVQLIPVALGQVVADLARAIGRSIIDDHDINGAAFDREDLLEEARDVLPFVISRDHDDRFRVHHRKFVTFHCRTRAPMAGTMGYFLAPLRADGDENHSQNVLTPDAGVRTGIPPKRRQGYRRGSRYASFLPLIGG